jgi:c(7)-type cytochrome triheme protein
MLRIAVLLSLLVLIGCTWNSPAEKTRQETGESPIISSLQDSSLPCFKCHPFEKFAENTSGKFSHPKHLGFGVHCNQCHTIKPHKEMALNENTCNNCHHLTTFTFSNTPMPVTFSHQNHTRRFSCDECHPKLFPMKRGSSHITMDELYRGNFCGKCHDGKAAFSSKECAKCHVMTALKKDFSYPSGDMPAAIFSHQLHTSMFECKDCHTAVFKYKKGGSGMKMDAIYQNKFCGKCHNGQIAFGPSECQRCHK